MCVRLCSLTSLSHTHTRCSPQTGPCVWLKVSDSGIGMANDQLPRVVQPFQQADASTTRRFGGSGLGLAICAELVRLLRGDFMYASTQGVGSLFVVAIPCEPVPDDDSDDKEEEEDSNSSSGNRGNERGKRDEQYDDNARVVAATAASPVRPARTPPAATTAGVSHGPVVLIADDNAVNIHVLQRQLQLCGCRSVVARNGQECLDVVRAMLDDRGLDPTTDGNSGHGNAAIVRVDAILMDLNMPVMDGLAATRAIRRLEDDARDRSGNSSTGTGDRGNSHVDTRRLPIYAVTADDPATLGDRCRDAGMDGFLQKPIVLKDLARTLAANLPVSA
jgi:CheY-like chemotaxis protein